MDQTTTFFSQRARWAGGQPIADLMHRALAHPHLISLAAGFVDQQSLPVEATREAIAELLADPVEARAALQYGTTPGLPELREALLEEQLAADGLGGGELTREQVIITSGSNQLLHLVTDTLCDPGDVVLCGVPAYFVYLGTLRNLGVRGVGIASDGEGLIPEALEEELERRRHAGDLSRVKALYLTSYFNNPSGVTLTAPRREAVLEIARRWSRRQPLYVIDDLAYRSLRYEGNDLPSLLAYDETHELVISAQTFSKSFSPGLRLGYGILPAALAAPVCQQKGNFDFGSPNFTQHLLLRLLSSGACRAHVERLCTTYRQKRDAMLAALERELGGVPGARWRSPEGGLYVWLELDEWLDTGLDGVLFEQAIAEGVLYVPGEYFYPGDGPRPPRNQIRLSFGVQSPQRIAEGIAAFARALAAASRQGTCSPA